MSASAHTNGRKSSNSSAVNTPASTPVTNGNSQTISQSTPPPPNNNAPKYGTLVPNRIFVGGISANTTEGELLQLFSNYGTVKAAKIIQDRAGVSKGYGFITFESEDDAKRPLKDADNIVLRERKLNIAPAIKKQPFNRAFDASSPSTVAPGNTAQYFFPPSAGVPYFQGGVTYYQQPPTAPGDPNSQPTTVYQAPPVYSAQTGPPQAPTYPSMMFPPPIYMPQQYAMPPMPYDFNYYPNNGGPQYMVGGNGGQNGPPGGGSGGASAGGGGAQGPPMPPPNSPPRPPCYNNQLPYAPDPVYYNLPVYGAPLEGGGPPLYPSEGLDMSNGGYTEVSQLLGDFLTNFGFDGGDAQGPFPHMGEPAQDLDPSLRHEVDQSPIAQPLPPPPPPPALCQQPIESVDPERQSSKTPVVSLLSMEQHQEKDLVSMQGGRRVKLQPSPVVMPPPPHFHHHHHHSHHPHHQNQAPPLYPFSFNGPPVRSQLSYKTANNNSNRTESNNAWRNKSRNFNATRKNNPPHEHNNNRNYDNSSRSSIRTDSNSSANAVIDENKNEETKATGGMPPLPPPPQPQQQQQQQQQHTIMPSSHNYHLFNGGSRTYQNSVGRRQNSKKEDNNNKHRNNLVQSQQMRNNPGQQQQPLAQNFVMTTAARSRNKRSTRRNVQSGGSPSEIGAGDAPLPNNNDVTDACKKMETLKM